MPSTPEDDDVDLVRALASCAPGLTWTFNLQGTEIGWLWQRSDAPPLSGLEPMRRPKSSTFSRHIAVTAYSMTNGASVPLESGLEHDLFRRLDRDRDISRIVSQPLRLSWKGSPGRHTPDLLTVGVDGRVTVWDVRAPDRQDHDFTVQSAITQTACTAVDWRYEVFGGMDQIERLNLMWLNGFRRQPPWFDRYERRVVALATMPGVRLKDLFEADTGSGELKSTVWHLVWNGSLMIDVKSSWGLHTRVTAYVEEAQ
jgi:hypothetical protein